jgi:hypothetical protein
MKRLIFILLFLVMGFFITITLSSTKVHAEPNEEETPQEEEPIEETNTEESGEEETNNEEEATTETNEDENTEVIEGDATSENETNYSEIRQAISEILDSIDELKNGNVNWFEDELINHLISLVFGAVGAFVVALIYLKKTKLVGTDITSLITKGKKTDEALMEDMKAGVEFVKQQAIQLGIKEEQINKLETHINNLLGNFNERVNVLESQLKDQKNQNNEMLEILKVAFLNNPELVRNGYANKIEGIISKYEQR